MGDNQQGGIVNTLQTPKTKEWYAWINRMMPAPTCLFVVGEVLVSNPGIMPILVPREPQGINPNYLMLELLLIQQPGVWPALLVWKQARYEKINPIDYTDVEIFHNGESLAMCTVKTIH